MNLLEFKRRLMTEPGNRDPEFVAARNLGAGFAVAAAESDRFERSLKQALAVPAPPRLAEEIILRQSSEATHTAIPDRMRLFAVAAALALTVAVGSIVFIERGPGPQALEQHLAWHWQLDGAHALEVSARSPTGSQQVRQVFSELGLHVEDELIERVRLSKFCPTPDGAGAHVVLETDDGPVTLLFMPRTQVPEAPLTVEIANGMEAFVVNLARGSLAVVAETGRDMPALAEEIRRQVSFPPGLNL